MQKISFWKFFDDTDTNALLSDNIEKKHKSIILS